MAGRRSRVRRRRSATALLAGALLLVACSGSDEQTTNSPAATSEPRATAPSPPTAAPKPEAVPTTTPASAVPTTSHTATTPEPEPQPLPQANAIGHLVAAAPGTFVTARPGAGLPLENGAFIVPVYDVPDGPPRVLVDTNDIDRIEQDYPLSNPTVFGEPLVLRVITGTPADEWVLVQAPVRPHRQHVWVRAEDFVFGQSSLRIEVDLGRQGRFALFDGEHEIINNLAVYGRESRPTVLHDTYVEQAVEGFNPAYGTYILTIASYSESLGTYGGGLPGQSIHGTNQPELVGDRVSSGGIRVPNEIIEFVYAQPGIIGASVLIYDSTGIGRDAAIALQRNKPWTPATTVELGETNLPDLPVSSYS